MVTGRRSFLKVGGATAAALALEGGKKTAAAAPRPVLGARQVLELDGQAVGAPHSASGGGAVATVGEFLDSEFVVRKQPTNIRYDPLQLEVGSGMSAPFFDWVASFFDRSLQRKTGALVTTDFNFQQAARREFQDAIVTEVSFPTLDGASKDPVFLTVAIQPEFAQFQLAKGGKVTPPSSKSKIWTASNFRCSIEGLEEATTRVAKIDAFSVKMKSVESVGDLRFDSPVYLEIENIVLTIPFAGVQPFLDWFDDFVIKGNNGPEAEKSGFIEWLAPNGQDVLLSIELGQIGIVSIGESKQDAGTERAARFQVELYVEEMKLRVKGSGA